MKGEAGTATLRYALITPARNEAGLIEATILAVEAQRRRPARWVIVSDGSTDGTDQIAQRHAQEHVWIQVLRMPEHADRQFAAKARAFNAGYERLRADGSAYDLVGNLDADITFGPDYFEFLLGRFEENPHLGVAGTPFVEDFNHPERHSYAHRSADLDHVSGACQMFRRACFEEIGGYIPIKEGAIDWIAVTTARMKGWETRTFLERTCQHHRKLGTGAGSNGALRTSFHYGRKAHAVGGHPAWECLRGLFQMRRRPWLIGGGSFLAGYLWAGVSGAKRAVPPELMAFHRAEQMARLRNLWRREGKKGARAGG